MVHIIDKVLQPLDPVPPSPTPPSPGPPPPPPAPGLQNIVELAESSADLTFLTTLLKSTGLAKTLSGPGPFTVFAPTNDIFAALPYSYVASLLDPANFTDVQKLLGFHVAQGTFYPADLTSGRQINTLEGDSLQLVHHPDRMGQDGIYIGRPLAQSNDLSADVQLTGFNGSSPETINASNGVVYLIPTLAGRMNGLLLPPGAAPIPEAEDHREVPWAEKQFIAQFCGPHACIFSFTNKETGCCGQVDAAPRMPPDIWSDPSAVVEYVRLTIILSGAVPKTLPPVEPCPGCIATHESLRLGTCSYNEYKTRWVQDGNVTINWRVPGGGFDNWCKARCGCGASNSSCENAHDNPATHTYCSLCSSKYAAPTDVQLYHPGGSSAKCVPGV